MRSQYKRNQVKERNSAGLEPDDEGGVFTSQSNGKIGVGGEEAMEPNLESLGERGGSATQGIII